MSGIAQTILTTVKVSLALTVAGAFMVALNALLSTIATVVFGNVIAEVLSIISVCLPFNALAVFGSIGSAIIAIGAFMVAVKIYTLTTALLKV